MWTVKHPRCEIEIGDPKEHSEQSIISGTILPLRDIEPEEERHHPNEVNEVNVRLKLLRRRSTSTERKVINIGCSLKKSKPRVFQIKVDRPQVKE